MQQPRQIDVSELIDRRNLTAFNYRLIAMCFVVALFDGYDITSASFAAPELIKAWKITNPGVLGPAFSASLLGILIGSPVLGFVGDRFGRKVAIIVSSIIFGVFTWACVLATSPSDLMYLRFLTGIGLGSLLPNIFALAAEFTPKRVRVTMIIIVNTGIAFGGSLPGLVSAWLVPVHGWQTLFIIGGVAPIVVALFLALALSESPKFLVLHGRRAEASKLLAKLELSLVIAPATKLVLPDETKFSGLSPKHLFSDGMAVITLLIWLLFVLAFIGYFFLLSWLPILLTSAHLPMSKAAIATSFFQVGGVLTGWALCRPMDKLGLLPITLLFAFGVPVVASIGYVGQWSEAALMGVVFLSGVSVLGVQFGLNAAAASIYPTAYRSSGSGWALGVGRVGSIVGPILGGILIGAGFPSKQLFVWAAIPYAIGAVVCFALTRLHYRRFRGRGLTLREGVAVQES